MVKISLICLGKLKEKYLRDACAEYEKRIGAFGKLTVTELTPAPLPDNPSQAQITAALNTEAKLILSKLPQRSGVVALCIEGKTLSSEDFSAKLEELSVTGSGSVAFIIGSSFGLAEEVKRRADVRLSMSPMTFPHQLARVMLLEQIYRAFQISGGGKYHK